MVVSCGSLTFYNYTTTAGSTLAGQYLPLACMCSRVALLRVLQQSLKQNGHEFAGPRRARLHPLQQLAGSSNQQPTASILGLVKTLLSCRIAGAAAATPASACCYICCCHRGCCCHSGCCFCRCCCCCSRCGLCHCAGSSCCCCCCSGARPTCCSSMHVVHRLVVQALAVFLFSVCCDRGFQEPMP